MCLSFGVFCVWLPLSLCKNFALHTVVFRLSASDLHLPLPFQTFAPSPFMFSSSHFSCSCCFFGDLICSVVTFFLLFVSGRITPLSISCSGGFLVKNFLSFCISGKVFISPSYLKDNFGYIYSWPVNSLSVL